MQKPTEAKKLIINILIPEKMYVENKTAKKLNINTVKKQLIAMSAEAIKQKWHTKTERDDLRDGILEEHLVNGLAKQLVELNEAMLKGRSVFAVCDKYPKNLDSGRHYYSVYYTDTKGVIHKIWGRGFACLIGQDIQDRDRNLYKYIFSSRAIGMSRLLDATDGLFNLLKKLGGCYAQISVI